MWLQINLLWVHTVLSPAKYTAVGGGKVKQKERERDSRTYWKTCAALSSLISEAMTGYK